MGTQPQQQQKQNNKNLNKKKKTEMLCIRRISSYSLDQESLVSGIDSFARLEKNFLFLSDQ